MRVWSFVEFLVGESKMEDFGVGGRILCLGCECGGLARLGEFVEGGEQDGGVVLQMGVGKKEEADIKTLKVWVKDAVVGDCC
jgi:hypothetical protein